MSFQKLKLKRYPKLQERETAEAHYWKSFSLTKQENLKHSPTYIDFNPIDNSSYIVSGSVKVSLFDSSTDKIVRSYTRFSDDTFSAKFRPDARLLVAGDKASLVKVFDVSSKALLREMHGHSAAVRCTAWTCDGHHILSGSDDRLALCWDLATEQVLFSTRGAHTDYIRALSANPVSPDIFATGGYDHCVHMWDRRQKQPSESNDSTSSIHSIRLPKPVESCCFTPSGTMLLAASGSEVHVYDMIAGGRLLSTFNNHQKNITSLCMYGTSSRVLSAGLDGHIKIYSLQSLQVVHGMKLGAPLLSLALSSDYRKLVAGFVNGDLVSRTRRTDGRGGTNHHQLLMMSQIQQQQQATNGVVPTAENSDDDNNNSLAVRLQQNRHYKGAGMVSSSSNKSGINSNGANSNINSLEATTPSAVLVPSERSARLQPYERLFKKFNYQAALDAALRTRNPVVMATVLEELCRRDGLEIALSGRDEVSLEPIVSFSARYVNHPKYARIVIQVVHKIIDIYANVLGYSDAIDELFMKLHKQVKHEIGFQRQILRVMGSLDGIISTATLPRPPSSSSSSTIPATSNNVGLLSTEAYCK